MKKLSRKHKNIFYAVMLIIIICSVFSGLILLFNYHEEGSLSSNLVLGLDKSNWLSIHIPINVLLVFGIMYHLSDKWPWVKRTNPLNKKIENRKVWRKFYSDLIMLTIITISALSGFASFLLDPKIYAVTDVHSKAGILLILFIASHIFFRKRRFLFLLNKDPKKQNKVSE